MRRSKQQRAQIFQPYDALKGFRDLLHQQERIIVPPKILSEDDLDVLDYQVKQIQPGMLIRIIYYDKGEYVQREGQVSSINFDSKIIQIVKDKYSLMDIVSIEFI